VPIRLPTFVPDSACRNKVTFTSADAKFVAAEEMRSVLSYYPTGVAIVTSLHDEQPAGFVVGTFTSISLEPPLVGFFVTSTSSTFSVIREAGVFCCNVLGSDHATLSTKFSSRSSERFVDVEWRAGRTGSPILKEAVAWIDCTVFDTHEVGDHFLVVGEVVDLRAAHNVTPLVFHRGRYGTTGSQVDLNPIRETMQ
jgi:3-hydroxy-9,10-secoandrosta-1,3,5(10)-triene-9,17-dione monooxygenase reductase component